MKIPDGRAIVRAKTQVHALRGLNTALRGDRELDAERPWRRSIVRTAIIAEVNDPHEAEWLQYSVVEAAASREVGYAERHVIEHFGDLLNARQPTSSSCAPSAPRQGVCRSRTVDGAPRPPPRRRNAQANHRLTATVGHA